MSEKEYLEAVVRVSYISGFIAGYNNTDTKYMFRLAKEQQQLQDKIDRYLKGD